MSLNKTLQGGKILSIALGSAILGGTIANVVESLVYGDSYAKYLEVQAKKPNISFTPPKKDPSGLNIGHFGK